MRNHGNNKYSAVVVEKNCLVAEYCVLCRIGPRTIIMLLIIIRLCTAISIWAGPRAVPHNVVRNLAHASCVIVSRFRAALELNPLSNLICPRYAEWAKAGRGKPVLIMHIGFFTCFHAICLECSRFSKIATFFFLSL